MTRISVDRASPAVKKFLRSLVVDAGGVEVTLGGNVVCKIVPAGQLSEEEKAGRLAEMHSFLAEARENSKRLPASVIESRIRGTSKTVRGKR